MTKKLSILESYTLKTLEQIEYAFDTKLLSEDDKTLKIQFGDIDFTIFRKPEEIYSVAEFLKEKDVNFVITFDLINDSPLMGHTTSPQISYETVELGYIHDENLGSVKKKIQDLKEKLLTQNDHKSSEICITLYSDLDALEINTAKVSVPKETLQRILLDILIDKGSEVSWDEIRDTEDMYSKEKSKQDEQKKRISDARRKLNDKITSKTDLKENLIKQRRNNYSLTKKVTRK